MTDTLIGAYIGIGGVILGALLTGPIAYYYSKKLILQTHKNAIEAIRITEFNKSVAAFRAAFAPTFAFIYLAKTHGLTHEAPDVDKFLKEAFLVQASAIEEFRFLVPKSGREDYQKAWDEYYKTAQGGTFVEKFIGNDDPLAFIEQKIRNILQFAKEK